jgi:superoxide reductase
LFQASQDGVNNIHYIDRKIAVLFGGDNMNNILFYSCENCGNIIELIKMEGGILTCCDKEMTKLVANSTDAAKEKHVPVAVIEGDKIKVTVGSIEHPMTAEHFIEWIALVTDGKVEIVKLEAGMAPKAEFANSSGEIKKIFTGKEDEVVPNCEGQPCNFVYNKPTANEVTVYAYCNLHGLWKIEI